MSIYATRCPIACQINVRGIQQSRREQKMKTWVFCIPQPVWCFYPTGWALPESKQVFQQTLTGWGFLPDQLGISREQNKFISNPQPVGCFCLTSWKFQEMMKFIPENRAVYKSRDFQPKLEQNQQPRD